MLWIVDWLACGLVRVVGWLLCRLPASAAVWIGERLGALGYWLQPKRTRIGLANLRAAFDGTLTPTESHRIIRSYYRQLGAGVIELLRLPAIDRAYVDRYITIEGRRWFDEAVASGQPILLLTGHYGNWELSSIVAALLGFPIMALARAQEKLPRLYRLLVSYRESKGCTIIHKGGAVKRLVTALENRQCIGIVGDQASRQGLFVDFFGRPALFSKGPFELAYRKRALVLPTFIHRLRGPFHRLVVEPPIRLSQQQSEDQAVRAGIEQFAGVLSRHIREDPGQWLWLHKRWKHTSSRRLLVLSDGKLGHLKQSLTLVSALQDGRPDITSRVVEIRYRHQWGRLLALLWSWWAPAGLGATRCLALALTRDSQAALLGQYADLVVSCGASVAPVNLLWAAENRGKSIVMLNPAPLPLSRFHLVIAPRHDRLPTRRNVVSIAGAVAEPWRDEALRQAKALLQTHPNFRADGPFDVAQGPHPVPCGPVIAVFVGGETQQYVLPQGFADALIRQVTTACETIDGCHLVTTSRRTSTAVERTLTERLRTEPRCRLLLIASRDPIDLPAAPGGSAQAGGTMEGMLGSADVAVVTGESISMVSEACASGRPVIVVEPPLRRPSTLTKHRRFLHDLASEGYVRVVPVPELGAAIQRAVTERHEGKRLDNLAVVRDALLHLL